MIKYRPHLDNVERPRLRPHGRAGKIGLDKNEAPFSPLEKLPEFYAELAAQSARTYPDPYPVYEKLARFCDVGIDQLMLTFGSEQAIRYAFELMIGSGDEVVYLDPTFAMIDVFARQFDARRSVLEFDDSRCVSAAQICDRISSATRLIVLPNPNNPTGSILPVDDLEMIAERAAAAGAMLVVDEAYYHYTDTTAQGLIDSFENVVVTRTFSKGWGLAGIRVGYVIAQPSVIELFRKLKPIDEVSTFSLCACSAALDRLDLLQRNVDHVRHWKERFASLQGPRVEGVEAYGNYVLLRVTPDVGDELVAWCEAHDMLLRLRVDHPSLHGLIRFAVGVDEVMTQLFDFLAGL